MRLSLAWTSIAIVCSITPSAKAWGAVGHEIVATIAQMYLHPSVMPKLCKILDESPGCHLAPVSTWADRLKFRMRWSGPLHYINALDDHPPDACAFPGPQKWAGTKGGNILDGIKNVTSILEDWVAHDATDDAANEALKFLVHFLGDLHQPLHLAGRDKGGNGIPVLFDRRHTNLHSVWDNYMLAKSIRLVSQNYSSPLPYPQVEKALRGTIYDPYIRRLMWEGVLNPWADEVSTWFTCPAAKPKLLVQTSTWQQVLDNLGSIYSRALGRGVEISPDGDIVCPYAWAQPIQALNCDLIWPKELDEAPSRFRSSPTTHKHDCYQDHEESDNIVNSDNDEQIKDVLQLDTPEYAGEIAKRMLLEKLLAQGGIRLAGLLNYLFAGDGSVEKNKFLMNIE